MCLNQRQSQSKHLHGECGSINFVPETEGEDQIARLGLLRWLTRTTRSILALRFYLIIKSISNSIVKKLEASSDQKSSLTRLGKSGDFPQTRFCDKNIASRIN
ncbi:MAG: hypothetical protein SCK70_09110 [bacterium]|nr:hypothetical protein [bacterium]